MAHAWKACWVKALGGSNPPSSAGRRARDLQRRRPRALRSSPLTPARATPSPGRPGGRAADGCRRRPTPPDRGAAHVSTRSWGGRSRPGFSATTTSASAAISAVSLRGTSEVRSMPISTSDARTVALTTSSGSVPAELMTMPSPARAAARPAASWERRRCGRRRTGSWSCELGVRGHDCILTGTLRSVNIDSMNTEWHGGDRASRRAARRPGRPRPARRRRAARPRRPVAVGAVGGARDGRRTSSPITWASCWSTGWSVDGGPRATGAAPTST